MYLCVGSIFSTFLTYLPVFEDKTADYFKLAYKVANSITAPL